MHRDLKPHNILIDGNQVLKLCDFGLARSYWSTEEKYTHEIITLWYRPPEIILGAEEYKESVDIWSVGCIFAEMAIRKPLFKGDSEISQLFKIFQFHGTPTEKDWPGVTKLKDYLPAFPKFKPTPIPELNIDMCPLGRNLLMRLIAIDPAKRIPARQALKHVFFI